MAFICIDPGNVESAYVVVADDLSEVLEKGKVENLELMRLLTRFKLTYDIRYVAIEMIASYGMAVGASVFDTCVWIGRFKEHCLKLLWEVEFVYRKEEKMLLCNSMKAKDSNIRQALVDRFAPNTPNKGKGYKSNPGLFYGFKSDIWQAYAVAVTYYDLYLSKEKEEE
jgi:hypothetical protein